MVRRDGTRRGKSGEAGDRIEPKDGAASELELGGSSGVLASEDSSIEPGEVGLLSRNSSGVAGTEPTSYR